ncbi:phage portal protein [Bradyrhizobium sp. Ai1a-2]|uniref:phage portal protein n=1 Tax=Bradyrhizobium sp. Ai1a-2 TaxID=196490 RepID=UPI000411A4A5|nr:phage portal protein [Bradyrhizobium sp. Ai1a-2]
MGWINNAAAAVWSLGRRADDSDQDRYYGDDADFYYESVGKRSTAGVRITPMAAMRLSAFAACAKVLAETIASLPVSINKIMPDDGRQPWPSHPIAELIRYQPNRTQTAVEFWESIIFHTVLFGTGYAEIVPGPRGAVDQLKFLRSDRVVQDQLRDETLRFTVSNPNSGGSRVLLQDEVLRIPSLSLDGVNGLSMIDLAAEAIGLGVAADQYASRIFSNNLNMGGFITTQKRMSREAIRNLIARLMEKYASPENFHRPAILQDGAKFEPAAMKASEAQLLEARKWQIAELARYFRIPLHMLGVDDQTNRSTVEEQSINFVKYTIRPWARRIEQAVRRDLIIATGLYEIKFNLDALERGNLEARRNYWSSALGSGGAPGWMTVNEVRVAEGMNRINEPWADQVSRGGYEKASPTPAGQQRQGSDDETDAIAAPAPKIEDNTPEAVAARVANKENATLRKASQRFAADPDGLREFIKAFYGGHVSFVMSQLGISRPDAKRYCAHQRDEALKANDFLALLDHREEKLAGLIAAVLKQHGARNGEDAAVQA